MIRHGQYKLRFGRGSAPCLAFFSLALLPAVARAQVTVTPNVTPLGGGVYHYDYTIANATANDLFDVAIHVLPNQQLGVDTVFNVTAPAGFNGTYTDSVLGLVDFTENGGFFTAAPLSGFTYDSFIAPQASVYDASQLDLVGGGIVTTTDTTLAAVPEPGSFALLGSLGVAAGFAVRRRRRAANAGRK